MSADRETPGADHPRRQVKQTYLDPAAVVPPEYAVQPGRQAAQSRDGLPVSGPAPHHPPVAAEEGRDLPPARAELDLALQRRRPERDALVVQHPRAVHVADAQPERLPWDPEPDSPLPFPVQTQMHGARPICFWCRRDDHLRDDNHA